MICLSQRNKNTVYKGKVFAETPHRVFSITKFVHRMDGLQIPSKLRCVVVAVSNNKDFSQVLLTQSVLSI